MTGFMPPVRRESQVQSGEPNNLRVGFRERGPAKPSTRNVAILKRDAMHGLSL